MGVTSAFTNMNVIYFAIFAANTNTINNIQGQHYLLSIFFAPKSYMSLG